MPSHALLSSRDGRIRSSSIPHGREPVYYSNEDIELLHQVVSLGQEILPTLPKRDRLPTTALFRAADVVFPRHGLDPDGEDKLSRIIFLVGGMRSTDNLLERFRTVLARMGIELEYVPESEADDQEADEARVEAEAEADYHRHNHRHQHPMHASPPSPSVSVAPSSVGAPPQPAVFPVAHRVNGRRRRHSASAAQAGGAAAEAARQSPLRPHHPPELPAPPRPAHTARPIDPWLSQIPQYAELEEQPLELQPMEKRGKHKHEAEENQAEDQEEEEEEDEEEDEEDEVDEVDEGDEGDEGDEVDEEEGEEEGDGQDDRPGVDEYTRSLEMLRPAQPPPQPNHHGHQAHTHNYQQHHDLPFRTRSHPPPPPSPLPPPPAAAASTATDPPSPASRASSRSRASDYEGFQGASDTTMQEELILEAGPPPKVDPVLMAKVADTYFVRFAFLGGLAADAWRTICAAHAEQARYAAQIDRELAVSEALLVWRDAAAEARAKAPGEAQEEADATAAGDEDVEDHDAMDAENDTDDADDETAAQHRQRQEERARQMRRAARVDVITTLFGAVVHWHALARDEADRTQVARRHLLRRKVFDAWREQTAVDSGNGIGSDRLSDHLSEQVRTQVLGVTVGFAVRRWRRALNEDLEENAQLADAFHHRDLLTVAFWTWLRAYQERTAAWLETARRKQRAVETWRAAATAAAETSEAAQAQAMRAQLAAAALPWLEQAQNQALVRLRIEEQEDETYARAALQDWAKDAFCRRQLRVVQAAADARTREQVLARWRSRAAEAQDRSVQLDLDLADQYAEHWRCEARLAQFRAQAEYDLKADAVHGWVLAERLAFMLRYRDELLLRKTCWTIQAVCGAGGGGGDGHGDDDGAARGTDTCLRREAALAQQADVLDKAHVAAALVSALQQLGEVRAVQRDTAAYLDQAALATAGLGGWLDAADAHAEMAALAQRGAFYVGVANALDGWPAHARAVREDRLRDAYRQFRRTVKRATAAGCVAAWRASLAHGEGQDHGDGGMCRHAATADQLRAAYETDAVVAALNGWIGATNDALFQQTVAVEADAEAYLSRWRQQLATNAARGAAAAEHATATQLAGRWDDWELQAVQARAWQHTAAALHEKNGRRLGRRVLAVWQQRLWAWADDHGDDDHDNDDDWPGVSSAASTPHWRLGASLALRSSSSSAAGGGGGGGGGPTGFSGNTPTPSRVIPAIPATRPASLLLHTIAETPVAARAQAAPPFYARGGTDRRRGDGGGGSYSVPAPGTAAAAARPLPRTAPPPAPSAGLGQLRRLYRSTAGAPYAYHAHLPQHQHQHQHQQQQQQQTPYLDDDDDEATHRPHRQGLLRQRLQVASRLADSVQLGPMSAFDGEEEETEEVGAAAAAAAAADDGLGLGDFADVSSEGDGEGENADPHVRIAASAATPTPRYAHAQRLPPPSSRGEEGEAGGRAAASSTAPLLSWSSLSRRVVLPQYDDDDEEDDDDAEAEAEAANTPAYDHRPAPRRLGRLRATAPPPAGYYRGGREQNPPQPQLFARTGTTTPMAPLPSPFERRLRAAYGGDPPRRTGAGPAAAATATATATPLRRPLLRASMASTTTTTATTAPRTAARVTFADEGGQAGI